MKDLLLRIKEDRMLRTIAIISILLILLLPYLIGLIYYSTHFFPGTTLLGHDVSGMNLNQANEVLNENDPTITVIQKNINGFTTYPQKLDLTKIDPELEYDASYALGKQNTASWFLPHDPIQISDIRVKGNYDSNKAHELVGSLYCLGTENSRQPIDAHVDIKNAQAVIVKEDDGSYIDPAKARDLAVTAILEMFDGRESDQLDLKEYYETAKVKDDDPLLANKVQNVSDTLAKTITIDVNTDQLKLEDDSLADLLTVADSDPAINEDSVDTYVLELSKEYASLNRAKMKEDLAVALLDHDDQTITANFEKIENARVEVDISDQTLYYYEDEVLVLTSPVVTGNAAVTEATPTGDFEVRRKNTDTYLMGRDYLEHVDYWIGWDPSGRVYGFHDAVWRDDFGGDIYTYDPSRGCVNMPTDKVGQLFEMIEIGTPVNIHE